jgi:hypothetical protein
MFRSLDLGGRAQASRDLARRARRLAHSQRDRAEKARLIRYAAELEAEADQLEREAVRSRSLSIEPIAANDPCAAD